MTSSAHTIRIALVGDMILDVDNPGYLFDKSRDALSSADVVVGQVEVPHSLRCAESHFDVSAPPSDPERLAALRAAHFNVATLAGNHIYDLGRAGIEDTLAALQKNKILATGAGLDLAEARRPAVMEAKGIRVGVLSLNCVGPKESKAGVRKPGAAFIDVITHYEQQFATPGAPPSKIYSFPDPDSVDRMQEDIATLRSKVDVVIVALHKGIGHLPAVLAMYERVVAKAAVEAGAQIVVGHHAHICRGIEVIGKSPVYHGLGNFVTATMALSMNQDNPERKAWAAKRKEMFGFEPDPRYPLYPFHPESRNSMIAVCDVDARGVARAGYLPCWINTECQAEVHKRDETGMRIAKYISRITAAAGLNAKLEWDGDQITFWRRP